MVLTVSDGSHLSLDRIEAMWRQGVSVLRSAHIGNLNAQTLFLAGEGYPVVLDEFAGGTMAHYRPAYLRSGGREVSLATDPRVPATHLSGRRPYPPQVPQAARRRAPGAVHLAALTTLFPTSVRLTAAVLTEQRPFVSEVLEVLAQHHPQSFRKLIDADGRVFLRAEQEESPENLYVAPDGARRTLRRTDLGPLLLETVERAAALGGEDFTGEALVLDVDTDVLVLTVSEVYRGRSGIDRFRPDGVTALHFSGLEMINYLLKSPAEAPRHQARLAHLYALLDAHLPGRLPGRVDLCVVPTGALASYLATNEADLHVLEQALAIQDDLLEIETARRTRWSRAAAPSAEEMAGASDSDIVALVRDVDVTALPSHFRRQVQAAQARLASGSLDRSGLLAVAVKMHLHAAGRYPDLDESRARAAALRRRLRGQQQPMKPDVTQWDVLTGTRLHLAQGARGLTQNELRLRWRQMLAT